MSKYPKQYQVVLPVTPAEGDKAQRTIGADIVRVVLTQPQGQGGLKIDDIRKRTNVLGRLDIDPFKLVVTEAERTLLLDLFNGFSFGVADANIVATYDAIVNAEDCTLGLAPQAA